MAYMESLILFTLLLADHIVDGQGEGSRAAADEHGDIVHARHARVRVAARDALRVLGAVVVHGVARHIEHAVLRAARRSDRATRC